MKAAIYSRKSKFTGKGESIENQVQLCKEYATKIGINEFIVYEDEGFSGGNSERPMFQKMLSDAKLRQFDVLICYRLDRISRNIADFSTLIESLQDFDIGFISIREQFDTSTPMGRAMMYIASVFAQLERETIAERIRDNMLLLARTGRWLGGKTPLGFKSEEEIYYDDTMAKRKSFKLSPVPAEQELVKLIYDKFLELGSLSQVETFCLQNHLKNKKGTDFDISILKLILTNPVYVIADELFYEYCCKNKMIIADSKNFFNGEFSAMVYNKTSQNAKRVVKRDESEWIVALGKHRGILPSKDWIRTQRILKENSKRAPREGTSRNALLNTLLICDHCRSKMRVTGKYKDSVIQQHYYKCLLKDRSNGNRCNIKNLSGKEAEEIVLSEIKKIALSKGSMSTELNKKKIRFKKNIKTNGTRKEQLLKQLNDTTSSIENLTMQLSQNQSSTAAGYIIKQIEKLDEQMKEIKLTLQNLESENEMTLVEQMNIDIMEAQLKRFAEEIDTLDFDEKKKLLQCIIKEIRWDGENLKVNLLGTEYG